MMMIRLATGKLGEALGGTAGHGLRLATNPRLGRPRGWFMGSRESGVGSRESGLAHFLGKLTRI